MTEGSKEELNYHKKKYSTRDPKTWVNRNYGNILTNYFEIKDSYFDGACVLDIGGGPASGLFFPPFLKASLRVVLDPLMKDYDELTKDFEFRKDNKVELILGVAENMPLSDKSFDYVLNFNSLDHWHDWQQGMKEAHRVMKDGAKMLLYVNLDRPHKTPSHPHIINEDSLKWIGENGFDIEFEKKVFSEIPNEGGKYIRKLFTIIRKD